MSTDKKTDARKLDHATLEAIRLRAVAAAKDGMKATDLAQAYGVNRRTVFSWLADFTKTVSKHSSPSQFRAVLRSSTSRRCASWPRP